MVLTGLGLITGEKADAGLVRAGAERADVDGEWRLPKDALAELLARLDEAGAVPEADGNEWVLLLGRSVAAGGRSRAFACGRSVPAATLAELSEPLIAVHGQSDQLLLRDPRRQRDLLDLFAGRELLATKVSFAADFAAWRAAAAELDDLVRHRRSASAKRPCFATGSTRSTPCSRWPARTRRLKAQASVLAHATDLIEEVGAAHDVLAGGDDPGDMSIAGAAGARASGPRACAEPGRGARAVAGAGGRAGRVGGRHRG